MLTPKYNYFAKRFWDWYIHRIIHSDFLEIRVEHPVYLHPNKSLLVLSNHFSWWDGFITWQVNRTHFHKKYHVMMLEDQLRKNSFLRTAGAFSIDRSNMRKAVESLNYAAKLLEEPTNMVLMFPQGQIESQHVKKPTFKSGVVRIARKVKNPFQVLFCFHWIDYLSDRKPTIYTYLKDYEGPLELESLQNAFYRYYTHSKQEQSKLIS
ncbi:MAG: lysophospholipid acyltransferase family protein [Flammeovirgaceae bacterium]